MSLLYFPGQYMSIPCMLRCFMCVHELGYETAEKVYIYIPVDAVRQAKSGEVQRIYGEVAGKRRDVSTPFFAGSAKAMNEDEVWT